MLHKLPPENDLAIFQEKEHQRLASKCNVACCDKVNSLLLKISVKLFSISRWLF